MYFTDEWRQSDQCILQMNDATSGPRGRGNTRRLTNLMPTISSRHLRMSFSRKSKIAAANRQRPVNVNAHEDKNRQRAVNVDAIEENNGRGIDNAMMRGTKDSTDKLDEIMVHQF